MCRDDRCDMHLREVGSLQVDRTQARGQRRTLTNTLLAIGCMASSWIGGPEAVLRPPEAQQVVTQLFDAISNGRIDKDSAAPICPREKTFFASKHSPDLCKYPYARKVSQVIKCDVVFSTFKFFMKEIEYCTTTATGKPFKWISKEQQVGNATIIGYYLDSTCG
jgi:hypothetical protein